MATLTGGLTGLNFDAINLGKLVYGTVAVADSGRIRFTYSDGSADDITGTGFTYSATGALTGGTVTGATETLSGATVFAITGFSLAATDFVGFVNAGNNAGLLAAVFAGADTITGTPGSDVLRGYAGDDLFIASAGTDSYDGGAGTNTLQLTGAYLDFVVSGSNGAFSLRDNRAGAPNGVITTTSIQKLQFAEGVLTAANAPTAATILSVEAAFTNTQRTAVLSTFALQPVIALADGTTVANPVAVQRGMLLDMAAKVDAGGATLAATLRQVEHFADATTAVATLSYEFFTGKTPTAAGYDYLVAPAGGNANNLNSAYYGKFTEENRYINFAVNLGKLGDGKAAFTAAYGALSLNDAVKKAYLEVFGFAADDAKVAAILTATTGITATPTRADYFAYYGGDGANGIGTKAAMVGYLLVEAVKADLGTYALANDAFMDALASGSGQFNVDLKAVYAPHSLPLIGGASPLHT